MTTNFKVHTENTKLAKDSLAKVLNNPPGFVSLLQRQNLLHEIEKVWKNRGQKFEQFVVVGIGGSSLGIRVIKDFFLKQNLFVLENVDHHDFAQMKSWVRDPKSTLFIFISKSGGTLETLVTLELISAWAEEKKFSVGEQSVVITEHKDSSLHSWAEKNHASLLEIPKDIGGRFSVLTTVGMFPALAMGLQPAKFWQGAEKAVKNPLPVEEFVAYALQSFDQQKWITQLWLYGTSLRSFGEWFVQLWSESLGKKTNRQNLPAPRASTPVVALGAIDQHSMLQQIMEGVQDKWAIFIRSKEHEDKGPALNRSMFPETKLTEGRRLGDVLRVEALATKEALAAQDIPTNEYVFEAMDEETLGYWFMFFELAVAGLGEAMDINAFDQPGVELGKRLAQEKLQNEKLSANQNRK